eukprot:6492337-Pyramimonas_sp.AAC.1
MCHANQSKRSNQTSEHEGWKQELAVCRDSGGAANEVPGRSWSPLGGLQSVCGNDLVGIAGGL